MAGSFTLSGQASLIPGHRWFSSGTLSGSLVFHATYGDGWCAWDCWSPRPSSSSVSVSRVTARNLRFPRVIPLAWAATSRPVAAPPEETYGATGNARVRRTALNGRLEGTFDQAARRLAQGYRQVPSGRLVVRGEPGAGKTVLAAMLNLGLLAEREPGTPVPVLLTLSS